MTMVDQDRNIEREKLGELKTNLKTTIEEAMTLKRGC